MVKRPLFWLLWPFMLGITCNKYICTFFQIIPIIFILFVISILFYSLLKKHYVYFNYQDGCLLFIPIIFTCGFLTASHYKSGERLAVLPRESKEAVVQGVVINVSEKSTYQEIYLSNVLLNQNGQGNISIGNVVLKDKDFQTLCVGDVVKVKGELGLCERARNPGNYDEYLLFQSKNIYYKLQYIQIIEYIPTKNPIYKLLNRVKRKVGQVYDTVLTESDSAILHAMVLGDKSELGADIKTLYQKAGISHILAISGLHISIIGLLLFGLLKKAGLHHNLASILCIVLIYLYGLLTGFSVSTNRAVVMMVLSLMGCLAGRTYDSLSAIAFSGFAILVQQPFQLFQCGFLLSFLAVIGAVWFYPICQEYVKGCTKELEKKMEWRGKMEAVSLSVWCYRFGKKLGKALLASTAIQLITLPVLMWFYFEFPIFSPFINLFVLPLMSLLLILALLIAAAGSFFLPAGLFLAGGVHYILFFYQALCSLFHSIPFHILITGRPSEWQIFTFYILLAVFAFLAEKGTSKLCILLLPAAIVFLLYKVPDSGFEVTFLDVGQGDCIFMETESGLHLLMDGGSTDISAVGKYRIQPFLLERGVKKLDYCFLSHMDADHINGVEEILELSEEPGNTWIQFLVLPKTSYQDEKLEEMKRLARACGTKVCYLEKENTLQYGALKIKCLHPFYDFQAETANDYSMVLEVSYEKFHMLLAGDVGTDGEESMLSSHLLHYEQYDILKAAHHGSKYTNSVQWLTRVKPKFVVVSSGYQNRYGHPHKETLERFSAAGSKILKTVDCGAVTVKYEGGNMEESCFWDVGKWG